MMPAQKLIAVYFDAIPNVERAKRLLTNTDWTIGDIAKACGFGASKKIYEAFMRWEGKTPGDVGIVICP